VLQLFRGFVVLCIVEFLWICFASIETNANNIICIEYSIIDFMYTTPNRLLLVLCHSYILHS